MKKRLLSALLALALVFVLLPTTALAEVTTGDDYDISINGRGWKFEKDTTSGAYIPVYYYHTGVFDNANNKNRTNDNLELTKEGNTVTITIRRGTSHDYRVYPIEFTLEKISTTSGSPYDYTPCIEMGNNNNLVITGKGTLNITRDEKNGIGAALCSEVGDITITDGITVKANFLKQVSNSTVGNAISVKDHNLIISGKNTKVEARNSSCNFQDLYDVSATVCVENGEIKVSDGATLSAINNFTNSYTSQYSYYSRAISGSSSKPCALTVTGENSCVIAETDNSFGKAYGHVNFSIDGAKIEVGTSSPAQTITDINNIKNYKYAKISVPALTKTPDVLIAGKNAVVGQWTNIPADTGTGSYSYDAAKKELTLKDVNITYSKGAIVQFMAGAPYIIKLEGTNSIKDVSSFIRVPENAYESLDGISVTISGSGSLEVTARSNAITMLKGDLVFNNTGAITLETNTLNGKAINVSGNISIGDDFNKNLRITADNGDMTFDPTNQYTDYNDLKNYKSITIASKPSETYYNGTAMKYGETRNAGSGTISCDENGAITLNGATAGTLEFRSSADSTLVLEGTSTLSSIETTQKDLTISGSGSLTVGSIKVHNQKTSSDDKPNLTINGGAHVTVNRPSSEDKPAVEVSGNLTVTGDGTQLSAECTAATNPAIEVGGNVTISGNPGTNAYTVKAYNKYDTPRDRVEGLSPSQMPSAFEISGNLSISGSAQVMAQTDSDGAAVWMPKEKVISVADASLIAQNSSHNFSTISFGDKSDMGNIYAKGQVNIVAENMLHSNSSLAHRAIKAFIYNHYSTGDSNPYYINVVSEGVHSGENVKVIPGHCTSTGGYKVTITRGDAYTTPQVAANYTIAGQTMYVGKYYKTDANGNITDGTAQDYNIYCDSENDFTLNNATISSTGTGGSTGVIMTNLNYSSAQFHIKLIGTNSINNAGHHAILGEGAYSTIIIENAENASNTSLTISGNFLPVYSFGNVTINAEVVIINTNGNLISTIKDGHANGAFDLGSGYKCYASASTTGNPLEEFNPTNYSTYKYLCVTTRTLETGGGSTHQHTSETGWQTDGTNHWKICSDCLQRYNEGACTISGYNNDNGASGYHKVLCSVGHVMKTESHDYEYKITQDGTMHYKECKTCHYTTLPVSHNFGSSGTESCECGAIPSHTHNLSGQKGNDETNHWDICSECSQHVNEAPHTYGDWITDTPATDTTDGSKHRTCSVCQYQENATIPKTGTGEIVPPTPDNPGTIVIIRPAEEEKPAQQPNPSTGANDLVGLAVAAAVAAALGSAALLRKHD